MKNNFPREKRIVTEAQFKQVFSKTKQKISTATFIIYCCYNSFTHPRLGVIIPKKNINKATKRNRFKRVVREWFRLNQARMKNYDVVIIVSGNAKRLEKKELNQYLEKQLSKLGQ